MKTVSFEVAKAIKAAGYPQDLTISHYTHYGDLVSYGIAGEKGYDIPTYLDVWLWLWREKGIRILFDDDFVEIPDYHYCAFQKDYTDPEEAISTAINQLVANNLIR